MKKGWEKRDIIKLLVLFAVLFIITYFYIRYNISEIYKAESLREWLAQFKTVKGISLLFFLYNIRPFFIILPASPLALAAGAIWGKFFGFILILIGALTSSTIGFFFGRIFGKPFFDRIHGKIGKIKSKIEKGGIVSVAFFSLIGFSLDFVSIASGLSRISYKDFITAILIVGPLQGFIAVYLGDFLINLRSIQDIFSYQILIILGLLGLGFVMSVFTKKYLEKKKKI